ncbi:MAG: aldo/keto reductase, partial [Verrucomicrobiota bacterium]
QENLEATIQRSVELGMNHIETARGYGSSERQLGWVLPHFQRDQLIIQTKVAPCEKPNDFKKEFQTSLKRLQLDSVDLLSIHGINNEETFKWAMKKGGCLEMARKLQKDGTCRYIGFSTHAECDLITKAICTDEFDYVNLHWYYIFQWNWPAILAAAERDMGVFIISPNDKGGMLYQPSEKLKQLCAPLHPMTFNDLFCLSHPQVHTLSLGASRPTDFDIHVEALNSLDQARRLTDPIIKKLDEALHGVMGEDFFQQYPTAIPSYPDVHGEINARDILRLGILAKGLDLIEYGTFRYNLLGNAGHWFAGKQVGELSSKESQALLDSLQSSGLAEQALHLLQETHQLLKAEDRQRLSES